jgi:hypothetical protein
MRTKNSKSLIILLGCGLLIACNGGSNNPAPTPSPTSSPTPSFCQQNVANFSSVVTLNLATTPFDPSWGPALANLPFPTNLAQCQTSASWNQARILAAAAYWVSQKVNYCHHHVPTWDPAYALNGTTPNPSAVSAFAACSYNSDIMPPVPAESIIRWNYSGTGNESASAWYNTNSGLAYATGNYAYGMDCSDYSKLVYAYAESTYFTRAVAMQAGQSTAQSNLAPNMPGFIDSPESDSMGLYSAGNLVCADGSLAPNRGIANSTSCNGHGGYISVFESNGTYNANAVTDTILNNLQPGDLIYIAGSAYNYNTHAITPLVTHVVMWTGQQIGSSSMISTNMIAPQTDIDSEGYHMNECNGEFWSAANNLGNWIISDSHYQGPDFRAFTNCFYRNQVWGVRRVISN